MSDSAGRSTLVLGLGNPVLSDDRVGLEIVREVARRTAGDSQVDVREAYVAGLDLLELLAGRQQAVLVDAIRTPGGAPGTIHCFPPDHLPHGLRGASSHEIDLPTVLALAARLGVAMPAELTIYAVEVEDDATFSEEMSTAVARAVPEVAALIVDQTIA